MKRFVIIGGGAAGFFAGINAAEKYPEIEVIILEGSGDTLQKVKVSGGGRCNVTHACFVPDELVAFYPRGRKELKGPFHKFMTGDTMEWFESRGVSLKIEDDNRVFPTSNSSQTIIDCFESSAQQAGVHIKTNQRVQGIEKTDNCFAIHTKKELIQADWLLVASGSNAKVWKMLEGLGHSIVQPVPSLFTFNISDQRLQDIPGVVVQQATVKITNTKLIETGPVLITHWGLSGPGILKLSSWGALDLNVLNYQFTIEINWLSRNINDVFEDLKAIRKRNSKKKIGVSVFSAIPKRLWHKLIEAINLDFGTQWSQLSNVDLEHLSKQLVQCMFEVSGKSTFKDEFVTAGGINLKEVDFRRFESKLHPNLFFAGEVLDIDALTGGFNFQNAWTGAWIVASSINAYIKKS